MKVTENVEGLQPALDLMIKHAQAGRGGSSGQVACAKIILALADGEKCDFEVLDKLYGKEAEAAATVLAAYLRYGESVFAGTVGSQIDQFKPYFA